MEQDFSSILGSLLEGYEKGKDPDQLIDDACKEAGLSDEAKQTLEKANECLDDFAAKAQSLAEAKEERMSRREWIESETERVLEGRTEEEKAAAATAISEGLDAAVKNALTEEKGE